MAQASPTPEQMEAVLRTAASAVIHAQKTRKRFGRRRTPTRSRALLDARERCAQAAEPLRSWIGMVAWHDLPVAEELKMKKAMKELRYERRQIDKMAL